MSKKITRFDVVLYKEVEVDTSFNEIGDARVSAYLKADDGTSVWMCYCENKEKLLDFIHPDCFGENLIEVLTEDEIFDILDNGLCCKIPYYFDGKEYFLSQDDE